MLDVAMNAQGVEVERHRRRPMLSGLHGFWSAGLGLGAGTASLAAAVGASPLLHFAVVATVSAAASWVLMRGLLRAAAREEPSVASEGGWTPAALLGVIAFCSFVGEGRRRTGAPCTSNPQERLARCRPRAAPSLLRPRSNRNSLKWPTPCESGGVLQHLAPRVALHPLN